jgi:hypothetical protein
MHGQQRAIRLREGLTQVDVGAAAGKRSLGCGQVTREHLVGVRVRVRAKVGVVRVGVRVAVRVRVRLRVGVRCRSPASTAERKALAAASHAKQTRTLVPSAALSLGVAPR